MRLVFKHCNISVSNKSEENFCVACCIGKAHRLHSPSSNTQYTTPLELVYSDLWGPSPMPFTQNFHYYITFVDAFSRFTWIYLLKTKSDALSVFKQFKSMAELQFGTKLKCLQTDLGGDSSPSQNI